MVISYLLNDNQIRIPNLIKWAGGKNNLVEKLLLHIPTKFNTYFEPFFGGGSLYWNLKVTGQIERAVISDLNPELVNLLQVLKNEPEDLSSGLSNFRGLVGKDSFYEIRERFNHLRGNSNVRIERASMLIYLNRNCFNGLWRTNKNGEFNVPYGYYKAFHLASSQELMFFSELLQDTSIYHSTYQEVLKKCKAEDFVYLDPPYYTESKTNFTQYTRESFSRYKHLDLLNHFKVLSNNNIKALMTNRACLAIREMYSGYNQTIVKNVWSINRDGSSRKGAEEIVIRNF